MHNETAISAVRRIVHLLYDSYEGFAEMAKHLKDAGGRAYCEQESELRLQCEQHLKAQARIIKAERGTTLGSLHRAWGEVEAHLGAGDRLLLETAMTGEEIIAKAYEDALREESLTPPIRLLIERQQKRVLECHQKLETFMRTDDLKK